MNRDDKIGFPREIDILCGRGRASHFHQGNLVFRSVVALHLPKYSSEDTSRAEKSKIVISVIKECFRKGCRFIKKDSNSSYWKELGLNEIKLKVSHIATKGSWILPVAAWHKEYRTAHTPHPLANTAIFPSRSVMLSVTFALI